MRAMPSLAPGALKPALDAGVCPRRLTPARYVRVFVCMALLTCAVTGPHAQAPAAPAPRWPDGRVNLGSTPDQKGYWEIRPGLGGVPRPADVPFQPWARALAAYRTSRTDLHPPLVYCKPAGGPSFFNAPGFEIVDVPELRQIFILNIAGPRSWRVIYMDGRMHPAGDDLRPTYFGHSIGRWEGDTLVVDVTGFNGMTWLDRAGNHHSEALKVTERYTMASPDIIQYEATLDDPKTFTRPWTIRMPLYRNVEPNAQLLEFKCVEFVEETLWGHLRKQTSR